MLNKTISVIKSCKTLDQFEIALNYARLANRRMSAGERVCVNHNLVRQHYEICAALVGEV